MPRYRCVVCNGPDARNTRRLDDRQLRVCDAHVGLAADELLSQARPAQQGSKEMFRLRAQLAARMRVDPGGDYTDLRRDLAFASIYAKIERELANGPDLTSDQRQRLINILNQ